MKKANILIFVLISWQLLAGSAVTAQVVIQGTIKGQVADEQKSGLPFATISLRSLPDSTFYQSALSAANGNFLFTDIKPGNYFLEISMMGFKKQFQDHIAITPADPDINLGLLVLKNSVGMLGEVTIKGKTSLIEKLIDRTVVNVSGSISAEGTTALELLQQLPGVVVSTDGQITLNGKTGVNVMIDGKVTQVSADDLANLLRGMSSAQIQKIEIMSNPSAKYDAAGTGGMINIIRKVNRKSGWTGSVFGGFNQAKYAGDNGGFTINDKEKNYNFYFTNTFVDNKNWQETNLATHILNTDQTLYQSQVSQNQLTRTNKSYLPSLGLDLYLSPKTTLTFAGTGAIQNLDNLTQSNMNEFDGNQGPIANILFLNNNHDHPYHYIAGVHLSSQLDTSGKALNADLDYASYKNSPQPERDTRTTFLPGNADSDLMSLIDQHRRLDIYAAKADYSVLVTKNTKLETGWKSSFVRSVTDYLFYNQVSGKNVIDPGQSDVTVNEENINAAYINVNQVYRKLTIEAGLRAEQTWNKGDQSIAGQKVIQNYFQLFPTVFLNYKASDQNGWNFQLGRRIDRADYSELAPLHVPQSPTLFFQGNPNLRPQTDLHGEVTYSWHHLLSLTAGYDQFHDYISTLPYLDSNKTTITRIPSNVQGSRSFNLDLSLNKDIFNWWATNYDLSAFKQSFSSQTGTFNLNTTGLLSYNLDLNNSFAISKTFGAVLDFRVISRHQEVGTMFGGYHLLNLGLKQRLWNNKGSLSLNLNNILQSENEGTQLNYQDLSQYRFVRFDTRALRLNFAYRFGSGKENRNHPISGAEDEQNRAGMSN